MSFFLSMIFLSLCSIGQYEPDSGLASPRCCDSIQWNEILDCSLRRDEECLNGMIQLPKGDGEHNILAKCVIKTLEKPLKEQEKPVLCWIPDIQQELGKGDFAEPHGQSFALFSFVVGTDGRAKDIEMLRSSGGRSFNSLAMDALRAACFIPALVDGSYVERKISVVVNEHVR